MGMTLPELEAAIIEEIGAEGTNKRMRDDWAEINQDIEKGMTRAEALQKHLDECQACRDQMAAEDAARNAEFATTDIAEHALMSPEEFRDQVARGLYVNALTHYVPRKRGQKANSFEVWYERVGPSSHQATLLSAMIHECPVNAAAIETYNTPTLTGYVKRGLQYVYEP